MELNKKWKINLICNNCTRMAQYEFPVRKRFYGYHPEFIGPDGEVWEAQDWSRIGHPQNPDKAELIFCENCKVPMLTGAPMGLQTLGGNPPPVGVK